MWLPSRSSPPPVACMSPHAAPVAGRAAPVKQEKNKLKPKISATFFVMRRAQAALATLSGTLLRALLLPGALQLLDVPGGFLVHSVPRVRGHRCQHPLQHRRRRLSVAECPSERLGVRLIAHRVGKV